jgi:hypothetical protein
MKGPRMVSPIPCLKTRNAAAHVDVRTPFFAEYREDIYDRLALYPQVTRLAFDFDCGSLWSRWYLSRAILSEGSVYWRRCESTGHHKVCCMRYRCLSSGLLCR